MSAASKIDYALYLITEPYREEARDQYFQKLRRALSAGVTVLQLREKSLPSRRLYELARELKALAAEFGVPFIVNDRLDIALAVDADGLHVGQDDLPTSVARRLLGPDKILGVSAATIAEAADAVRDGADYLGVGSVFPTRSKGDAEVIGLDRLTEIKSAVPVPVVAIGGITQENAGSVLERGADGLAVISAVLSASDPAEAAAALAVAVKSSKG
ncbi:thiamine phosphate synthase [Caenibacillus caldisaponilyticus]|uniref:thiamine phosphate synthase n=1 Tax=Caenibacillus caldisaponilyticus TaxID=1674942 RepID=UPI00098853E7|nr:thiamine phosphate synthase [Caenibacillus caldisaponilyticus]